MQFRSTAKKAAMTGALASLALGAGVPAASAAQDVRIDGKYGYVTFKAYGEIIEAADIYKDGYGVRAYLKWEGGSAQVTNAGKLYPVSKNLSIPEGTTVYLRMCYTNNGKAFKCSAPKTGEA
ncbi:MAG TPA: hypothetical protein VNS09_25685 [Solirubrobacter sp.]|nr:hypothetical protein [Solirubrobacter sp.]